MRELLLLSNLRDYFKHEGKRDMAFKWNDAWNQKDDKTGYANNVGKYSKEQLTKFLENTKYATGDEGLLKALNAASSEIEILKGLHDKDEHITIAYCGGTWHVIMIGTGDGSGYRVKSVTQWKKA